MAMPERAMMLASTPKYRMKMKHISTASGRSAEINSEARRLATMNKITRIVTRICKLIAS